MWNITWVTCTYTHLWTVLLPGAPLALSSQVRRWRRDLWPEVTGAHLRSCDHIIRLYSFFTPVINPQHARLPRSRTEPPEVCWFSRLNELHSTSLSLISAVSPTGFSLIHAVQLHAALTQPWKRRTWTKAVIRTSSHWNTLYLSQVQHSEFCSALRDPRERAGWLISIISASSRRLSVLRTQTQRLRNTRFPPVMNIMKSSGSPSRGAELLLHFAWFCPDVHVFSLLHL